MKTLVRAVSLVPSSLLALWGTWLLATDDPDGGRHPMGIVILVVALLTALPVLALWLGQAQRPR